MSVAEKIAILTDSCSDVPPYLRQRYHIHLIPQLIIYPEGEYRDGVDITPSQVYRRFPDEIPSTSLPSMTETTDIIQRIAADGFNRILVVTISSGLSGTFDMIKRVPLSAGVRVEAVDTLNIGIGSGFSALLAGDLIEKGTSFDEVVRICRERVSYSKLFIAFDTLEYLRRGGRIGHVASSLGTMLDLKLIVSCDKNGCYYTAAKTRGRRKSLKKALEMARDFAGDATRYNLTVMHADAPEEAEEMAGLLTAMLPHAGIFVTGEITPALVVHTGPGLLGIGVQILP